MFLGEYEYHIDQKGRISIPARFRQEFQGGVVLSRGFDKCIIVHSLNEWRKATEHVISSFVVPDRQRRLNRVIFSASFNQELDRQGRVILPLILKEYAEIRDGVVIVGMNTHLEIWSKENWELERTKLAESAWRVAEGIELRR